MSGMQGPKTLYKSQLQGGAYQLTRSPEAVPFWEGCRNGRLMLPRCDACGRAHFYPRRFCPYCDSTAISWMEASGKGTIYTFAIVRQPIEATFASLVPYCIAIVHLEEDVRMLSRIVAPPGDVACEKPVTVSFEEISPDLTVPVFTLARS